MKRIIMIFGIILAFVLVAVAVVLATRQDVPQAAPKSSIRVTQSGGVIVEPSGYPSMMVVAQFSDTNLPATAASPR